MGSKRIALVLAVSAACLVWFGRGDARADLIVRLDSVTPSGGDFAFDYSILLAGGTTGEAIVAGDPVEFVTLYDVPAGVSLILPLGNNFLNAMVLISFVGLTPAGAIVTDDPSLLNITLRFFPDPALISAFSVGAGFEFAVASLTLVSPSAALDPTGEFAGQALEGGFTGPLGTNQGLVTLPAAAPQVPEPATWFLVALGGTVAAARKHFGVRRPARFSTFSDQRAHLREGERARICRGDPLRMAGQPPSE